MLTVRPESSRAVVQSRRRAQRAHFLGSNSTTLPVVKRSVLPAGQVTLSSTASASEMPW
jgi:hypothetical protein